MIPLCLLVMLAQAYLSVQCYEGNDRACFMISNRHDVTVRQR